MASNTIATYRTAIASLNKFRQLYSLPQIWPVPLNHTLLFLAYCFDQGHSPSTLYTYCSGISAVHKLNGWSDPTDSHAVKKLLEGSRRSRIRIDPRLPICEVLLAKICYILPQICYDKYEFNLFRAAFTLAYFGLLRVSELVFTSQSQANRPLFVSDVQFNKYSTISIKIRTSKTHQSGKPVILNIPTADMTDICCVRSARSYMSMRPNCGGYFLCHSNKSPLTRYQFSCILSKAIAKLGLQNNHYKTHSFRIGRATDLSLKGVPSETIKKMGRWSSDTYKKYIRT